MAEYREERWLNALRWVMTQPGLLEGLPGGHEPLMGGDDPRLIQLIHSTEEDASEFMSLVNGPRGHKVGIAFEALMQWGLEQGLGYQCLARDVQVMDDKRTMGALDLILTAPNGEHEHWELAYKLFLQVDDGLAWSSWLGPGGRDRLDTKVTRMLNHQLPLSTRPEAVEALNRLGVTEISRRRVVLQGVLFTPWGASGIRAVSAHLPAQGRWIRPSQVSRMLMDRPDSMWVKREKPHWFGPWVTTSDLPMNEQVFHEYIMGKHLVRAELWSRLASEQHPVPEMIFVVPEDWGLER